MKKQLQNSVEMDSKRQENDPAKMESFGEYSVQVAVFRPLFQSFSYSFVMGHEPQLGDLVEVPFGRTKVKGVVLEKGPRLSEITFAIKAIAKIYPPEYRLCPKALRLAQWMAEYYFVPLGEVFSAMSAPSPLQKAKEWSDQRSEVLLKGMDLKPFQQKAVGQVTEFLGQKPVLLHGITGSGKTEVYLHFIDACLAEGKSCLFLLPEITLTRETLRKLGHRYRIGGQHG